MPSATPADVLARRRQLILDGDADLFAPDAVLEAPFTGPPSAPLRLEGREGHPRVLAPGDGIAAAPGRLRAGEAACHTDPEVVVAEVRTSGTMTSTGRSFTARRCR